MLDGRLRLVLGEHDLVLEPGEAAEFDTRDPHWFGAADGRPVEFLSLFGKQGERAHLRAAEGGDVMATARSQSSRWGLREPLPGAAAPATWEGTVERRSPLPCQLVGRPPRDVMDVLGLELTR